jgi:hypothetical protein
MPLRHRHGYAADLHRDLPAGDIKPAQKFPARHEERVRAAIQPVSTGFELADHLERLYERWFLSYTFSTRLPGPHHPVVLARPGVVGAASHPHRRLPDQAAPSFTVLLRQSSGGGLSPPLG